MGVQRGPSTTPSTDLASRTAGGRATGRAMGGSELPRPGVPAESMRRVARCPACRSTRRGQASPSRCLPRLPIHSPPSAGTMADRKEPRGTPTCGGSHPPRSLSASSVSSVSSVWATTVDGTRSRPPLRPRVKDPRPDVPMYAAFLEVLHLLPEAVAGDADSSGGSLRGVSGVGRNHHRDPSKRRGHPSALPSPLRSRSRINPRLSALLTVPRGALSCSLTSRSVKPWRYARSITARWISGSSRSLASSH
jgi:hypothetical protein